jgi:hypothetical protein
MKWARIVARMGEIKNGYKVSDGKLSGNTAVGALKYRLVNNTERNVGK